MAFAEIHLFSDVLERGVSVNVFIPEDRAQYKTLWLFHGLSDDHTAWQRYSEVEPFAARAGLAVVMPNAERSFYTDTATGERYFTFITEELPAKMRAFFRGMSDRREDNFAAGLSMGGYGAFKAALTYPDRYAAACSLSGALDIKYLLETYKLERLEFFTSIFGDMKKFEETDNNLFRLLEKRVAEGCELPKLWMACGTEDAIIPCSRRFAAACDKLGVEIRYTESPGYHRWVFWNEQIKPFLEYVSKNDFRSTNV